MLNEVPSIIRFHLLVQIVLGALLTGGTLCSSSNPPQMVWFTENLCKFLSPDPDLQIQKLRG